MDKIADFVRICMVNLKNMNVQSNNVGEGGLVKVFDALLQLAYLERLFIGGNSIGCADVEALARLIRPDSGSLKELHIADRTVSEFSQLQTMSPECQKLLIETLIQPSSLESLTVLGVDTSSARDSFALLANNSNLTSISVNDVGPTVHSVMEALKDNKTVKALTIAFLRSANVGAVVNMLTANKCLETLEVSHDFYEWVIHCRKACLDIINALKHNNTLKRLRFPVDVSVRKLFTQAEKDKMDPRVVFESIPTSPVDTKVADKYPSGK